ncbi:type II toxin-antitoxin system VapC family toxin [Neorhizobium galegae]|uniref:PilT protein domain protein n=2 Tax=Neorhizobium galegae TaxID=399 RepID=A0A068SXF9_NEOGA|nr:type II toxin-antitoxin system VapC family toxin [Neorhizobium galegae]KAB1089103.1 type II toxin-antitoxin system VapC family toxin [Neorhizobium galegae]MCQ1851832.1 type II toxin-antitoxin system VapC family toxin [Neorhizobium galegae]CDN50491.1 PilT protein domain protein [Neorhizobium galegae bv. orientalis str. HAMBI 540]
MRGLGKIYLDTNIFILAFENNSEISTALANLLSIDHHSRRFATSELTLSELLVKPYRDGNDSAIDRYEGLIQTNEWLEVLPVGRQMLWYAAILRSQNVGLKLPDSIHISTAFGAGCTHLLTADMGLKDIYEITHFRYGLTKGSSPLTVLRPDETTLSSLIESLGR